MFLSEYSGYFVSFSGYHLSTPKARRLSLWMGILNSTIGQIWKCLWRCFTIQRIESCHTATSAWEFLITGLNDTNTLVHAMVKRLPLLTRIRNDWNDFNNSLKAVDGNISPKGAMYMGIVRRGTNSIINNAESLYQAFIPTWHVWLSMNELFRKSPRAA